MHRAGTVWAKSFVNDVAPKEVKKRFHVCNSAENGLKDWWLERDTAPVLIALSAVERSLCAHVHAPGRVGPVFQMLSTCTGIFPAVLMSATERVLRQTTPVVTAGL